MFWFRKAAGLVGSAARAVHCMRRFRCCVRPWLLSPSSTMSFFAPMCIITVAVWYQSLNSNAQHISCMLHVIAKIPSRRLIRMFKYPLSAQVCTFRQKAGRGDVKQAEHEGCALGCERTRKSVSGAIHGTDLFCIFTGTLWQQDRAYRYFLKLGFLALSTYCTKCTARAGHFHS